MYPNVCVTHPGADLPLGEVALAAAWARSEYYTDEGLAMDDPGITLLPWHLGDWPDAVHGVGKRSSRTPRWLHEIPTWPLGPQRQELLDD